MMLVWIHSSFYYPSISIFVTIFYSKVIVFISFTKKMRARWWTIDFLNYLIIYTQYGECHSTTKTWKSSLTDPLPDVEFNLHPVGGLVILDFQVFIVLCHSLNCAYGFGKFLRNSPLIEIFQTWRFVIIQELIFPHLGWDHVNNQVFSVPLFK